MAAGAQAMKLVLCGNGSVGKSSIIRRFVADGFDRQYKQTVGLDFFEKAMRLKGDEMTTLQVWDIGGQSIASAMLDKYMGGAHVVFLCYDITDTRSFADVDRWLAKARAAAAKHRSADAPKQHVFLVANKADMIASRAVSEREHDEFVATNGLDGGFFVSARNGDRVTKCFYAAAAQAAGVEMSAHDLAFHDTVVGYSAPTAHSGAGGTAPSAQEDAKLAKIREEDAEAERRMMAAMEAEASGESKGACCAVM